VSELVDKLFAIHDALAEAGLAHAFGGAIALAYCVEEPRGTRDLDVNIFTPAAEAERALRALPDGVAVSDELIEAVRRDGQARLKWDGTPIDVFLNNHPFHDAVAEGVVWVPLEDREVPVLDCASLVTFKAFFDRTKDWADIEAVAESTPDQVEAAAAAVAKLVGDGDPACQRLKSLLANPIRKNPQGLEPAMREALER
jgi:Nucleotidyl transferase AbiEii toxin, Type IV TA system